MYYVIYSSEVTLWSKTIILILYLKEQKLTSSKTHTNSKELKISNQIFPFLTRGYVSVRDGELKFKWGKIIKSSNI